MDDSFFDIDHLHSDLKRRTVRGALVNVVSQSLKFLVHMASTIVLARILTPNDYGLFGMVTALTGFVGMFRDMGLSMATIQKPRIDHAQTSILFWVNVGLSVGVMFLTIFLAPAISKFYGEPRLTGITIALAAGFLIGGLSVQHQALIRRQMRFSLLAVIEISAMFLGVVVAILAGINGWGYWALVCMQLTIALTTTVMSWAFCLWRPGWPRKNTGARTMISFGGNLTIYNFVNYFARNLDNVLIGKYLGPFQLGLYSKAYNLLLFPLSQINTPITHVAISALSRLQNDPDKYRNFYFRAMNGIAYLTIPLVALLAALSEEIILIMLGPQWSGASKIFRILAFAGIIQPIVNLVGWVYITLGQTDRMMKLGFFTSPMFILSFIIGLKWGAIGVAASYAIFNYILFIPIFWIAFRKSPLNVTSVFKNIWKPMVIGVTMFIVVSAVKYLFIDINLYARTALSSITGLLCVGIVIYMWSTVKSEAYSFVELIRNKQY